MLTIGLLIFLIIELFKNILAICLMYYIFVYAIVTLLRSYSSDYLFYGSNGNFSTTSKIEISLFIKDFNGLVFYGMDGKDRFAIELVRTAVIFKSNKYQVRRDSKHTCGCSSCSDIYMTFKLLSVKHEVDIKCNGQTSTVTLISDVQTADLYPGYPIPDKQFREMGKVFLWLGNIGPFNGIRNVLYLPIKNQLFGCLDTFQINDEMVHLEIPPTNLFKYCQKPNSDMFEMQNCTELRLLNRTLSAETRHGTHDNFNLSVYTPIQKLLNLTTDYQTFFITRLAWRLPDKQPTAHCLIEIKLNDNSSVLFYNNRLNELIMMKQRGRIYCEQRLMSGLLPNVLNIFSINLTLSDIAMAINGNSHEISFRDKLLSEPLSIHVGVLHPTNICTTFHGDMHFLMFSAQIENNILKDMKIRILMIFITPVVTTVVIINVVIIIAVYCIRKRKIEKSSGSQINAREILSPNIYDLELDDVQIRAEFEAESSNRTCDSAGYEVIEDIY